MATRLFTIYDLTTGIILRSGACSEEEIGLQRPDESTEGLLLDVAADASTSMIDIETGEVIDLPDNNPMSRRKGSGPDIPVSKPTVGEKNPTNDLSSRIYDLENQLATMQDQMAQIMAKLGL